MNKYYASMVLAVFVSSFSQMLLKKGAKKDCPSFIRQYLNVWVILGYFLMVVSTILVIIAYKGIDYKNGPVIESFGFVLVMILSRLIFSEKITTRKIAGMVAIIIGIAVFYI